MNFVMYYFEETNNEIFWIASSKGNEEYLHKGISEADSKKFVLATTNISGYHVKPVLDANGKIIGSSIDYCANTDLGGSIPMSIINSFLPQSAIDSVEKLLKKVEEH